MPAHPLLPLFLAGALTLTAACSRTQVRQLVRQVAEQPVDPTGYARQELSVAPFTAVEIDCMADVSYECDSTASVSLMAPPEVLRNLVVKVDGDTLLLSFHRHYRLPERVVPVVQVKAPQVGCFNLYGCKCLRLGRLHTALPLQLMLSGVGSITSEQLQAPSVSLTLNGAGNICLNGLRTDRLTAAIDGTGEVNLEGSSRTASFRMNGSGTIDISALQLDAKPQIIGQGQGTVKQ